MNKVIITNFEGKKIKNLKAYWSFSGTKTNICTFIMSAVFRRKSYKNNKLKAN